MIKQIISVFALFLFSFIKAQYTAHPMLGVSYIYQNQNFTEVGGKVLFLKEDNIAYRIGGGAVMGSTKGNFVIMPKIQMDVLYSFQENVGLSHGYYYLLGAESTNKYLSPYLGISVLGLLDFKGGYGISYSSRGIYGKELKGLNFSISLNIPFSIFQ